MRIVILSLLLLVFIGCSSSSQGKVSASEAVAVIQNAESTFPGVKTTDAIAGLLGTLKSRGRAINIVGWTQDYKSGGTHDVWFKVKVNNDLNEFHWAISPDGTINPVNQLAMNVTKIQQVK